MTMNYNMLRIFLFLPLALSYYLAAAADNSILPDFGNRGNSGIRFGRRQPNDEDDDPEEVRGPSEELLPIEVR